MASPFRSSGQRVPAQGIPGWARARGRGLPPAVRRPGARLLADPAVNALLVQSKETFPATVIDIPDPGTLYNLAVGKAGGGSTVWLTDRESGDVLVDLAEGGTATWPASGTAPALELTASLAGGGTHSWPLSVA